MTKYIPHLKKYLTVIILLLFCLPVFKVQAQPSTGGYWNNITWPILDCPQHPQYDFWERNCLIRTAEPYGEIRLPQGGVDGLNLEVPMWITIPTNRPTWAIAIAHAWNLHRNMIQKVNFPKIGYYMAITGHETGMGCDCAATFSAGHTPWTTTGGGMANWPSKCGVGARHEDGCFQMENYNAWGEMNQIMPHRFGCDRFDDVVSGNVFETQALAMTYRNFTYHLLMEYSWNMNPWEIFEDPRCDPYAYEKFLAASWNGSISGTYATMAQTNAPPSTRPNPINMFTGRTAARTNPNWDLDGTVAYYPEVIAWSLAAIEGNTAYAGYQYDARQYWGALVSTGTGAAGERWPNGTLIPAGATIPINSANGEFPGYQTHVQLGYYNGNIYWSDVSAYLDRITVFYDEFASPAVLNPIKARVQSVFVGISGGIANPVPFKELGPVVDEIILSFPKENSLIAALQTDGLPHGPNGNEYSTCSGKYSPASHIVPKNITSGTICKGQTLVLAGRVAGGEEPDMRYTWFQNGAQVHTGVNDSLHTFTAVTPGNYEFELIVCNAAGGCSPACSYRVVVNNCSACALAATTSQVNTPCKNTEGGSITVNITGSANYTLTYSGPNSGSIVGATPVQIINNLKDGVYNITIRDNASPTCYFTTSQTVGYNFNLTDVVRADLIAKRQCEVDLKATIVKENCQCDYTVHAVSNIPNRWERYITMKITPTNGMFEIFRGDVFSLNSTISRKFQLCNGDSIKGEMHIIPASGSCDPRRTDAVNYQRESYTIWITNPNGTEVFRRVFGPGTVTQGNDYQMFNIPVVCPYTSSYTYTYLWNPSLKTTAAITEQNSGNVLYTVTATNVQNPQCKLKDTILVNFGNCNPLPVQFISIHAKKTDFGAIVSWEMMEDSDYSPYIIERSPDPSSGFTQIGTMAVGSGSYKFYDMNVPDARVVYYRVVKRNEEGQMVYSPVVSISSYDVSFNLYPNPFSGTAFLRSNNDGETYDVQILDALGQVVETHVLKNNEQLEIGNTVSAGVYVLKIYNETGLVETLKLVKAE
ncbi:MAG: T9SS type A sorting domain-containing protein [Cytophagaceae bacterium]|nr:T9SS type A sorting domain-containing protein [Cytophagaceae bacterium]